uniref:F-box domain-containing protein n=1 Tax=Romanomermis culicivorax TaxID=13658 RepID=A0A915K592_ROMCU
MSTPRRSLSNVPPMNMPPTSLQTIGSLPDKTFMQIFSYLDHKQVLKCAEVAKRWRSIAYDPRLWQMVSLRSAYGGLQVINQEAFLALIGSRFGTSLRLIELQTDLITPIVIQELATKCSYLQHFTLDFSTAMQLHDFADLQSFPARLKSLTICLSENIFLEGFMRKIYTFINSLEILHLIGTYEKIQDEEEEVYETVAIQKLKSYTPNLRVVNFWGVLFITDEHVESLSSNTAHLECLSVCFCMKFVALNNQAMKNVEWDKCQLQELNIAATDLTADTLIFMLTRLPFLRTLCAGYSENFNDQVMEAWINSNACSNLTALDLDTCDSLSEPILTDFLNRFGFQMIGLGLGGHHKLVEHFWLTNLPILSHIKILVMGIAEDCCSKVTAKVHIDQFIDCIAQNCPQLERLEIRWDQSTLRFSDKSTKFIDSLRLKCTKMRSIVLTDGQYFEMIKSNFERADRMSIVRSNTNYQTNMILLSPYYKALLFN